jgi:hypothetical protein
MTSQLLPVFLNLSSTSKISGVSNPARSSDSVNFPKKLGDPLSCSVIPILSPDLSSLVGSSAREQVHGYLRP